MELFTEIKDALITRLRSLPWMDERTQKEAQDKVRPGERDCGNEQGVELGIRSRDRSDWRRVQQAQGHTASIDTTVWHTYPRDNIKGRDKGSKQEKFCLTDSR